MASYLLGVFVVFVSILFSSNGLLDVLGTNNNYLQNDASVTIINGLNNRIAVFSKSQECWKCGLKKEAIISVLNTTTLNLSTNFKTDIFISQGDANFFCNMTLELQEGNEYNISVKKGSCDVTALFSEMPDPNIPIYCLAGAVLTLILLWEVCVVLKRKGVFNGFSKLKLKILKRSAIFFPRNSEEDSDFDSQESTSDLIQADLGSPDNIQKNRIHSIDAFRGFCLMMMIFVNYGGGGYWYFHHSAWDGITVADLVFPGFVFIMGMTAAITFESQRMKKVGRFQSLKKILLRSVLLFCLGIVLSNRNKTLSNLRIMGVLQRLALTFFLVGAVETLESQSPVVISNKWLSGTRDILPYWRGWVAVLVAVVIHSSLTYCLPVPGCPKGYLGPGGLHDNGSFVNCTGGASGYIERVVMGDKHVYQRPTCKVIYESNVPFDPEGILGVFTSFVTCYLGVQSGRILLSHKKFGKIVRWIIWAVVLGLLGGGMCEFKKFGGIIPLNKNLWSLSFVFVTSSLALVLFIVFYLLIDHMGIWTGIPFIYPGTNSIVVYMCSEIFEDYFPLHLLQPSTHLGLTLLHSWGALFWILVAMVMHHKKIFVAL